MKVAIALMIFLIAALYLSEVYTTESERNPHATNINTGITGRTTIQYHFESSSFVPLTDVAILIIPRSQWDEWSNSLEYVGYEYIVNENISITSKYIFPDKNGYYGVELPEGSYTLCFLEIETYLEKYGWDKDENTTILRNCFETNVFPDELTQFNYARSSQGVVCDESSRD